MNDKVCCFGEYVEFIHEVLYLVNVFTK